MGDYKFDTFYYSEDKSNEHYLSEIENLSEDDYKKNYKGKMYCPYCNKPQLTLVRKEGSSFLRTYPNQIHAIINEERCPYESDTASNKVVEDYIQELREKKKIKSLLESIMRLLFKQSTEKKINSASSGNKSNNPLLIEKKENNKTIKKNIIPHYSFKSWGKNIPQDRLLVVYGKVYIDLKVIQNTDEEGNVTECTYIHFKDIKNKKLITSCRKPKGMDIREGYYYAVVLGSCYAKPMANGYVYHNLRVNFPDSESIILRSFSPDGIA